MKSSQATASALPGCANSRAFGPCSFPIQAARILGSEVGVEGRAGGRCYKADAQGLAEVRDMLEHVQFPKDYFPGSNTIMDLPHG